MARCLLCKWHARCYLVQRTRNFGTCQYVVAQTSVMVQERVAVRREGQGGHFGWARHHIPHPAVDGTQHSIDAEYDSPGGGGMGPGS